ncbi:MAG: hypothetical protein FWE20_03540 [Defluviitaleaceae bacterium]|nr:hypothetical protein [Defluviitaleaceae bacterium]
MRREISAYTGAKKNLLKLFRCEADLPIRVLTDITWHVEDHDGVSFLHYQPQDDAEGLVSVIVNRNGEPWITEMNELTLVVAIDCIKFAFIFKNKLRTSGQ